MYPGNEKSSLILMQWHLYLILIFCSIIRFCVVAQNDESSQSHVLELGKMFSVIHLCLQECEIHKHGLSHQV